ncbi:phage tail protein [Pseudomonas sp. PSE14]|uniref:phage tail protein n=1 Tax=Pseudomonas sp. PSE14 TaxID=3016341 RepID=UPI0023D8B95C|nr:phage tail protein [Pseudomonas sp. PSE14]WEJ72839.1 phage tail protein [Pseudomonas sp. PSE14]
MTYLEQFHAGLDKIAGAATAARRDLGQVAEPLDKAMLHIRSGVSALEGLPGVTAEAAAKLKRVTDGVLRAQGKLQNVVNKAQREQEKLQQDIDKAKRVATEVNERVKKLGEEVSRAGQAVNKVLGKIDPRLGDILPTSVLAPKLDPSEQMCKVPQHLLIMTPLKSTEHTYYFNVDTTGFQRLTRTSSYAWRDQARLGRRSAQQSVGLGPETLTLSGVVMPLFIRAGDTAQRVGWNQPRTLRDIAALREPVHLGTGRGDDLGNWCLTKITETQEALFANGVPRQQTLDLEFTRYGDDDSQKR